MSNIRTGEVHTTGGGVSGVTGAVGASGRLSGPGGGVSGVVSESTGGPGISDTEVSTSAVPADLRSTLFSWDVPTFASIVDTNQPILYFVPAVGFVEQEMFGSVTPISPGTTAYIGVGWSVTEGKAEFMVLVAGNVTDFGVSIGEQNLGTGNVVVTLRRNGVDTPLTITLTAGEEHVYVSGGVFFAKGDIATIKAVVSADVPGNVIITPTWRLEPFA